MTPDEIRKIAIQAGFFIGLDSVPFNVQTIEAFVKLVAQHERKACAKIVDEFCYGSTKILVEKAIRARGQA